MSNKTFYTSPNQKAIYKYIVSAFSVLLDIACLLILIAKIMLFHKNYNVLKFINI